MSYIKGYKDAIEMFEDTVNTSIKSGIASKEDLLHAYDSVITTLYVAKLSISTYEDEELDERLDGLRDKEFDEFMSKNIDDVLSKILSDVKRKKEVK